MGHKDPGIQMKINGITCFKKADLDVLGKIIERYAIKTHFVMPGEDLVEFVSKYALPIYEEGDILSIGEKVAGMCQNSVVHEEDIKVGFWARFLSRFASSSSAGVGVDEPRKMQLAINIAGLSRVLWAALCSGVTKLFGKKGVFYQIVGHNVVNIDGFYYNSSFEYYKTTAVLSPNDPDSICEWVQNQTKIKCMITDANDFGAKIMGKSSHIKEDKDSLSKYVIDNPSGQNDQLTPLILVRKKRQC